MAKISDGDLNELIKKGNFSHEEAKRLRAANDQPDEAAPKKPRGHGAAAPAKVKLGDEF